MEDLAKNCKKTISDKGYVALIVEAFLDEKAEKGFLDLPFDCTQLFLTSGFKEVYRISAPLSPEVKDHHDVLYAKNHDPPIMLDINRDLMIFRKC